MSVGRLHVTAGLVVLTLAACSSSSPSAKGAPDAATHGHDAALRDGAREARSPDAVAHDAGRDGKGPAAPALPVAPVAHQGRWLTDATGRVLLPHGVNVVNKNPPYYPSAEGFGDDDAAWLADNGFRVVRVGVLATGLMPTAGVVDAAYMKNIAATVETLADHDVFSLLDLHQDGWGPEVGSDGFPAWMTLTGTAANITDAGFPFYYEANPALEQAFQSFWDDATGPDGHGVQDDYAAMFGALATAFAGQPYVLGYDLFNEPWPGTTWMPCQTNPSGCPALDTSELAPAYAKAVASIRAAGDTHVIFGEPFVIFNFGLSTTSLPIPGSDSNAGMAFHVYPLAMVDAPNVIGNALTWAAGSGGALLTTEWGASTDPTLLTTESTELDSALIPWIFWSFDSELVPSLDASPGGSNLVASTAASLVEAYPLAVAGTPTSLTVDPTSQTMSFAWSTARAGGGTFAKGTVTTFEAPAMTYPSGYTATVTNGTVTSAGCAPLLTVVAKTGASTASVDIAPGGTCP